jgi:hypothetical protein
MGCVALSEGSHARRPKAMPIECKALLSAAERAKTQAMRANLATMAGLWTKLAAETEFDQMLLSALSELELGEPYEALPFALNLHSRAA